LNKYRIWKRYCDEFWGFAVETKVFRETITESVRKINPDVASAYILQILPEANQTAFFKGVFIITDLAKDTSNKTYTEIINYITNTIESTTKLIEAEDPSKTRQGIKRTLVVFALLDITKSLDINTNKMDLAITAVNKASLLSRGEDFVEMLGAINTNYEPVQLALLNIALNHENPEIQTQAVEAISDDIATASVATQDKIKLELATLLEKANSEMKKIRWKSSMRYKRLNSLAEAINGILAEK